MFGGSRCRVDRTIGGSSGDVYGGGGVADGRWCGMCGESEGRCGGDSGNKRLGGDAFGSTKD